MSFSKQNMKMNYLKKQKQNKQQKNSIIFSKNCKIKLKETFVLQLMKIIPMKRILLKRQIERIYC